MKFWKISYLCVSWHVNAVAYVLQLLQSVVVGVAAIVAVVKVVISVEEEEGVVDVRMVKATVVVLMAAIGSLRRFTAWQRLPE